MKTILQMLVGVSLIQPSITTLLSSTHEYDDYKKERLCLSLNRTNLYTSNSSLAAKKPAPRTLNENEFLDINNDSLLHIFCKLNVASLLALEQTNSLIRNFIQTNTFLWHQVLLHMPDVLIPKFQRVVDYKIYLRKTPFLNLEAVKAIVFNFAQGQKLSIDDNGRVIVKHYYDGKNRIFLWKAESDKIIELNKVLNPEHRTYRKSHEIITVVNDKEFTVKQLKKTKHEIYDDTGTYSVRSKKNSKNCWQLMIKKYDENFYRLIIKGLHHEFFKPIKIYSNKLILGQKFIFKDGKLNYIVPFYVRDNIYREIRLRDNSYLLSQLVPVEFIHNYQLIKLSLTRHNTKQYFFYDTYQNKFTHKCKELYKSSMPGQQEINVMLGHNKKYNLQLRNKSKTGINFFNTVVVNYNGYEIDLPLARYVNSSSPNKNHKLKIFGETNIKNMCVSPSNQWLVMIGYHTNADIIFRVNLKERQEFLSGKRY